MKLQGKLKMLICYSCFRISFILLLILAFIKGVKSADQSCENKQNFPLFTYRNPDETKILFPLMSRFYANDDLLIVGYIDLYNETFSNSSVVTIPYAMRISSEDGTVQWAKAAFVKNTLVNYACHSMEITNDQTAWFLMYSAISRLYRIDSNGNLLQIICFGLDNLSFATTYSLHAMISDTEFLMVMDLSGKKGGFNAAPGTGTDFSVARISTDLSVK